MPENPFYKKVADIEKNCVLHNVTLGKIEIDIALIKQCLLGNPHKNDGIVDKVNKHDMYFYVAYGFIVLLGVLMAQVKF